MSLGNKEIEDEVIASSSNVIWFHRVRTEQTNKGFHCFICDKPGAGNSQLIKCGYQKKMRKEEQGAPCPIRFHQKCLLSYNSAGYDSEIVKELFHSAQFVCPLHYCDCCYFERRKFSAISGNLIGCSECFRSFHRECRPVGVFVVKDKEGNEWTKCHSHIGMVKKEEVERALGLKKKKKGGSQPSTDGSREKVPLKARVSYCCECQEKDEKENLKQCSQCMYSFHEKCAGKPKGAPSGDSFCEACIHGENIRIGQPVITLFQRKFYAGVAVDTEDLPPGCRRMDPLKTKFGHAGYIPVRWAGCNNIYNVVHARTTVPMFQGSFKIFPIDKDPDFVKGWKDLEKLKPIRPVFSYKEINKHSDHYEKIERSVYHRDCPKTGTEDIDLENYDSCNCLCVKGKPHCFQECLNRSMGFACPSSCEEKPGTCMNRGVTYEKDLSGAPEGAGERGFPTVDRRLTTDKGYGMFTVSLIRQGTFIAEYAGEIISKAEENRRVEKSKIMKNNEDVHYMLSLDSKRTIDSKYKGNFTRFVNHSCSPNCEIRQLRVPLKIIKNGGNEIARTDMRVAIIAVKTIKPGEELSFNYRMEEYVGCEVPECLCGSENCESVLSAATPKNKGVFSSSAPKHKSILSSSTPKNNFTKKAEVIKPKRKRRQSRTFLAEEEEADVDVEELSTNSDQENTVVQAPIPVKRGRGRPRKEAAAALARLPSANSSAHKKFNIGEKKPRGRPRKVLSLLNSPAIA